MTTGIRLPANTFSRTFSVLKMRVPFLVHFVRKSTSVPASGPAPLLGREEIVRGQVRQSSLRGRNRQAGEARGRLVGAGPVHRRREFAMSEGKLYSGKRAAGKPGPRMPSVCPGEHGPPRPSVLPDLMCWALLLHLRPGLGSPRCPVPLRCEPGRTGCRGWH